MSLVHNIGAHLLFERPARNRRIEQFATRLERDGRNIEKRIANARRTENNRSTLIYLIGMERWNTRRLSVAQGAGFNEDDYTVYRPAADTAWDELLDQFAEARAETVALAHDLSMRDTSGRVKHDTFGEMTIPAWLHYIDTFTDVTSRLLI